jgi:hypothetical protein
VKNTISEEHQSVEEDEGGLVLGCMELALECCTKQCELGILCFVCASVYLKSVVYAQLEKVALQILNQTRLVQMLDAVS